MKILHTSDWHLGQQLYGYDRTDEHLDFFRQLSGIIVEENPDALLVSGDIFDVSTPPIAVTRLFTDFIISLNDRFPNLTIVIISGNHDSASRIDINRNLWRKLGIHVIGKVNKGDGGYDYSDNIIKVGEKGLIVALPFVNRAFMSCGDSDEAPERQFFGEAGKEAREIADEGMPIVLMGHLAVEGSDMSSHRFAQIGNVNAVESDIFGPDFDYIALGHIHKPQTLDQSGKIRYSGSPAAVSFDEDFSHTVSIVEVEKGVSPNIREIEIYPFRQLLTFPETATDFKTALKLLRKFPATEESYIRLNVMQEEGLPADCEEQAAAKVEGKKCRYCLIKYTQTKERPVGKRQEAMRVEEFTLLSPEIIAQKFFESIGLDSDESAHYREMLTEIKNDIENQETM